MKRSEIKNLGPFMELKILHTVQNARALYSEYSNTKNRFHQNLFGDQFLCHFFRFFENLFMQAAAM
jgi:hypothetical protein